MLSVEHVSKGFAGVQALEDVNVEIGVNEVVGLVGENGAGKSTLMRILAGVYSPDSGSLKLDGAPVLTQNPRGTLISMASGSSSRSSRFCSI